MHPNDMNDRKKSKVFVLMLQFAEDEQQKSHQKTKNSQLLFMQDPQCHGNRKNDADKTKETQRMAKRKKNWLNEVFYF